MSEDAFDLVSDIRNQKRVTEAILAPESDNLEPVEAGFRKIIIIDILSGIHEKIFPMGSVSTMPFAA